MIGTPGISKLFLPEKVVRMKSLNKSFVTLATSALIMGGVFIAAPSASAAQPVPTVVKTATMIAKAPSISTSIQTAKKAALAADKAERIARNMASKADRTTRFYSKIDTSAKGTAAALKKLEKLHGKKSAIYKQAVSDTTAMNKIINNMRQANKNAKTYAALAVKEVRAAENAYKKAKSAKTANAAAAYAADARKSASYAEAAEKKVTNYTKTVLRLDTTMRTKWMSMD